MKAKRAQLANLPVAVVTRVPLPRKLCGVPSDFAPEIYQLETVPP
jgi:hypothetical protein